MEETTTQQNIENDLVGSEEVCKILEISLPTCKTWADNGKLPKPAYEIGTKRKKRLWKKAEIVLLKEAMGEKRIRTERKGKSGNERSLTSYRKKNNICDTDELPIPKLFEEENKK